MQVNKNPEYFLTIAAEGSISRAAKKLYVSQPYLSQHVTRLEQEFGVQLLDRSTVPLTVTAAGEIYVKYLESSRQLHQKLLDDFASLGADREQTLRLGFSNWRASTLLPDVLPLYSRRWPQVRIDLFELPTNELYRYAERGDVDFAVTNAAADAPDAVTTETILYERILLVGHRDNPVTAELTRRQSAGEPLDLHLLEDERVILLQPKIVIAERVRNFLDQRQIALRNVTYCTNATTALRLAAKNYGFCFINETGVRSAPERDALAFFDLNAADMVHPLCVIYRKSSYLRPAARGFIDVMSEFYRDGGGLFSGEAPPDAAE